ncbi:hypothetical protein BC567DRAFT_224166 [Phyllosticta citribraziliensis]
MVMVVVVMVVELAAREALSGPKRLGKPIWATRIRGSVRVLKQQIGAGDVGKRRVDYCKGPVAPTGLRKPGRRAIVGGLQVFRGRWWLSKAVVRTGSMRGGILRCKCGCRAKHAAAGVPLGRGQGQR